MSGGPGRGDGEETRGPAPGGHGGVGRVDGPGGPAGSGAPGSGAPGGTGGPDATADLSGVWEQHARWWQEEFTEGADVEYAEQLVPLAVRHAAGASRVVDVGCGEGQIARAVVAAGAERVVGVDASWAQITEARRRGGGVAYVRASATAIPLATASFDAAVSCLVLEHVPDLDGALDEVARLLRPGGRFVVLINHPLFQTPGSGWIDDRVVDPPEQYWRVGPYLPEAVTVEEVDAGVRLPFFHRPLGRYVNALAERGMYLTRMLEPSPPARFLAMAPQYEDAAAIPRLLLLRAEKR